jgi:hypothetical protein
VPEARRPIISRAQDQAWREKRRIRELEELRARAGGIQFGGGGAYATPAGVADFGAGAAAGAAPDATRRLSEAKKLLDERLITDSEYEAIKARILSGA